MIMNFLMKNIIKKNIQVFLSPAMVNSLVQMMFCFVFFLLSKHSDENDTNKRLLTFSFLFPPKFFR